MDGSNERIVIAGPAELVARVGETLGTSPWRSLDQSAVDTFAKVTGDEQWIHVDPARAAAGPFGTTIAHGFLTLSLCPVMVGETVEVERTSMQINYGLDRVRFPAPVSVGSRVRATVAIKSAEEVAGSVQAVFEVVIEAEGGSKPVCVAETVSRFYP